MTIADAARGVAQGAALHQQTYRPIAVATMPQGSKSASAQDATDPCAGLTGDALTACRIVNPDSAGGGTWSLVTGGDGIVYERNSTTGESRRAPDQFQQAPQQETMLPVGQYPIPMASAFEALAGVPPGPGPTAAGDYLAGTGDFTQFAGAKSALGQSSLNSAQMAYLNGSATAQDINLLLTGNQITMAQALTAMKGVGGLGGGGGGGGYVDNGPTQQQQIQNEMNWQQLLNNQKQQEFQNILDRISANNQQRTMQMTARNNANTQLQNAGPNLVGNAQYFGGWAPGGPGPALARMNGLTMGAVPTAGRVVNLNIDPNVPPPDPALQELLARIGVR